MPKGRLNPADIRNKEGKVIIFFSINVIEHSDCWRMVNVSFRVCFFFRGMSCTEAVEKGSEVTHSRSNIYL